MNFVCGNFRQRNHHKIIC